eukprot:361875-Chlamydomonas_euryale.AAC.11
MKVTGLATIRSSDSRSDYNAGLSICIFKPLPRPSCSLQQRHQLSAAVAQPRSGRPGKQTAHAAKHAPCTCHEPPPVAMCYGGTFCISYARVPRQGARFWLRWWQCMCNVMVACRSWLRSPGVAAYLLRGSACQQPPRVP